MGSDGQGGSDSRNGEDSDAAEERCRRALELAGVGTWEWRPGTGRVRWSEQVERLWGYPAGSFPETLSAVVQRIHPEDRAAWREDVRACVEDGIEHDASFRVNLPDGAQRWMQARGDAERDASGQVTRLLGVVMDITERKLTELRQAWLRRLHATLNECNQVMARISDPSELLAEVCRVAVEVAGLRLVWIATVEDGHYAGIAAAAGTIEDLDALQRGKEPVPALVQAVCESGTARVCADLQTDPAVAGDPWLRHARDRGHGALAALPLLHGDGVHAGVLSVHTAAGETLGDDERWLLQELAADIAFALDKLARAAELADSEAKYRLLVENQTDLVVKVDTQGRFEFVSPSYCRAFGRDESELLGRQFMPLVHEDNRAAAAAAMRDLLRPPFSLYLEQRALTADGWRWFGWSGTAVRDADGQVTGMVGVGRDISARKEAETALAESELRFRELVDNLSEGVIICQADPRHGFTVIDINPRALEIVGRESRDAAVGRSIPELLPAADALGLLQVIDEVWRSAQPQQLPGSHYADGRLDLWLEVYVYRLPRGEVVAILQDVTERKRAEERIHQLAFYDPLTGVANRRLLRERLAHAMASGTRHGRYGAVLMLDLDYFKAVNDSHGHDAGDALLMQVAGRLIASVRQSDTVGRTGGDEFVVLLESLNRERPASLHEADRIAEQIRSVLQEGYDLDAMVGFRATCSIGVTLFQGTGQSVDDVIKQADLALYEAKRAGRDTVRFFNAEMQQAVDAHVAVEAALNDAIGSDELELHFQPQIGADGQLLGVEALLRWRPRGGEPVPPARFIPLAEETGLILAVGRWVLTNACARLAAWQRDDRWQHLTLSVNVSTRQLLQPHFADDVAELLIAHGARPEGLCLELTETALREDLDTVVRRIRPLKQLGMRLSLDDFGTGFSSLVYLKRLPLDEMKIDTSFVHDIPANLEDAAIVRTILAMGRSLQLRVIAEGVETNQQLRFLSEHGCSGFQGHFFAQPMPAAELEAWMQARPGWAG